MFIRKWGFVGIVINWNKLLILRIMLTVLKNKEYNSSFRISKNVFFENGIII